MGAFAEPITVNTTAGSVALQAHYRAPWVGANTQGVPIEREAHTLDLPNEDLLISGVVEGDTAIIRGVLYVIIEVSIDDSGMARLLLRPS